MALSLPSQRMPKTKYKFNHETLSFDKMRLGIRQLLLRLFGYFVGSLFLAGLYGFIFAFVFDSPKEKTLKREIEQLTLQYELMNREMDNVEKVLGHLQETDDNLYRTIFEAEPVPSSYRVGGIGGVNRYEELQGFTNSELIIETATRLDKIRKQIYVQSQSFDELIAYAKEKEEMLSSIPAIQPISNEGPETYCRRLRLQNSSDIQDIKVPCRNGLHFADRHRGICHRQRCYHHSQIGPP